MNVYILGAGFSKCAGYPLGNELLGYLRDYALNSNIYGLKEKYKEFEKWIKKQRDILPRRIIESGNPEYILTYLDTAINAIEYNRDYIWQESFSRNLTKEERNNLLNKIKKNYNSYISEVSKVRRNIKRLIADFFEHQHYIMASQNECNENIRNFCENKLNDGDIIISFNYDSLLEICLFRLRKWSFKNGYGFPINLVEPTPEREVVPQQDFQIKILKLHGSVGWYKYEDNNCIFLLYSSFLQFFNPLYKDKKEPDFSPEKEMPAIIEPSFIKLIDIPEINEIWKQAAQAIAEADKIYIIGYSLPEADIGSRILLNSSISSNNRSNYITIIDKNRDTINRYKELIGEKVKRTEPLSFEEWCKNNFQI